MLTSLAARPGCSLGFRHPAFNALKPSRIGFPKRITVEPQLTSGGVVGAKETIDRAFSKNSLPQQAFQLTVFRVKLQEAKRTDHGNRNNSKNGTKKEMLKSGYAIK